MDKLKRLENDVAGIAPEIRIELYRLVHRQFPWQVKPNRGDLLRYYQMFSTPDLQKIVAGTTGIEVTNLYRVGMAFAGFFMTRSEMAMPPSASLSGITEQDVQTFLRLFATDLDSLRALVRETQSYDVDYTYTFNPLWRYPLLEIFRDGRRRLIAPLPTLIIWRISQGLYYEVCDVSGFGAAFGESFEAYAGEALSRAARGSTATVLPEREYFVGKRRKQTVDLIFQDESGALFLECKAKRIRYAAKFAASDPKHLEDDLNKLSDFVLQVYRSLLDAIDGHYLHWESENRELFPVVVTLEDWYIFNDRLFGELDARVSAKLTSASIPADFLERYPYSICSIKDLENATQVMGAVGVSKFMNSWLRSEKRIWHLNAVLVSEEYRSHYERVEMDLFPEKMGELVRTS